MNKFLICAAVLTFSACTPAPQMAPVQSERIVAADLPGEPSIARYTDATLSGLKPGRPFPFSADVCVRLLDNATIVPFKAEGSFLIGCPKHERGALADRIRDGAKVVANTRHWVVLNVQG
ncbi:MAG: hypothetical protein ACPG5U_06405 [Planktomarina sp.]